MLPELRRVEEKMSSAVTQCDATANQAKLHTIAAMIDGGSNDVGQRLVWLHERTKHKQSTDIVVVVVVVVYQLDVQEHCGGGGWHAYGFIPYQHPTTGYLARYC